MEGSNLFQFLISPPSDDDEERRGEPVNLKF